MAVLRLRPRRFVLVTGVQTCVTPFDSLVAAVALRGGGVYGDGP
jgi:hypothetical protein